MEEKISGFDLGGGDLNIKLSVAVKNLNDIYYIISYLELIGMINGWGFDYIKEKTSFIINGDIFSNDEEKYLMNDKEIKESFYALNIHTCELFNELTMTKNEKNIKMIESQVAKKGHIKFDLMKKFKGAYLPDIILTYDGTEISKDLIVPCTLNSVYKNKWYKLNSLKGLNDYVAMWYWYTFGVKTGMTKIPDDYYLIDLSMSVTENWRV